MSDYKMYVRIEGEPFLSRVKEYREERHRVTKIVWDFAKARGALEVSGGFAMKFPLGKVPDGWKKPDRRGWTRPKKGHPDASAVAELPRLPESKMVFGDALCFDLRWEGPDGSWGGGGIGYFFFGADICFCGDQYFAVIPDTNAAARDHLKEYPDHKITSGADTWKLPGGLTRITKAEMDLAFAQFDVEQERKARGVAA